MADISIRKGNLLVAAVTLSDPNFERSVVLLCGHQDEAGTYGLILNRPVKVPPEIRDELPYVDHHLFEGGPVGRETLQILHPFGDNLTDSVQVLPGVWIGGNFEEMHAGFSSGTYNPKECRFFLGYSGWSKDQLASEFQLGTWLQIGGTSDLVFGTSWDKLWFAAIRRYGKGQPLYAHYPEDPTLN